MASRQVVRGRSFERLVNFSDAVVAVAVTVLVLPIVDIAAPASGQTMWSVMVDNAPQLLAYIITFFVVIVLWRVHHRLFSSIDGYDGTLFALNTVWLITIAFLPWPGNMIEDVDSFEQGVGVLYFGVLAANSILLTLMFRYVRSRPVLWEEGVILDGSGSVRGIAFATVFVLMAVLSAVAPRLTPYVVLLLPVLTFVLPVGKVAQQQAGEGQAGEGQAGEGQAGEGQESDKR